MRVTLRPPAPGDADAARRLGRYPEIARLFGEDGEGVWRELTEDEARDLIASLGPSADRIDWVVDAGSGFIGTAALHSFEDADRTAAYAVGLLAPGLLGHGLGTEITRLVLAYAFGDLGLEALTVRVLASNTRAIACYVRCGFSFQRSEPDSVVIDGVSCADAIMRLDARRYCSLAIGWRSAPGPPPAP